MANKRILLTGGAGFIGSNLVPELLSLDDVDLVRVLDNYSTGFIENIREYFNREKFECIEGDIRDRDTCMSAMEDITHVSHQAALGSVPRSIKDPQTTHDVNVNGSVNIFLAAIENRVRRVVFASSSAVYGDDPTMPKREEVTGKPLSPYAVTKVIDEQYAEIFARCYPFEYIGFRYFNVFGPKQSPEGPYAAVIPLWVQAALTGNQPTINGDGSITRDFTYISNVVQANILALFTANKAALNQVMNIGCGQTATLNELWKVVMDISQTLIDAHHGPEREGDIQKSLAQITRAEQTLGYKPEVDLRSGLQQTISWWKQKLHAEVSEG